MKYIYPKFSKYELIGIRFGGAGLGNLLFMWARAIVAAKKNNCEVIWPTWPSIKIGPWLRHEKDKRFYGALFVSKTYRLCKYRKYHKLLFNKKIHIKKYDTINWKDVGDENIVVCDGFNLASGELQMNFKGIMEYRDLVCRNIIQNLGKKGKKALMFNADKNINVHVRLGDFSKTTDALRKDANNMRIPIEWYVSVINKIRDIAGYNVEVNLFSDGTDNELKELLCLKNLKRVTFGNSIADIVALSKAPIMIASGSSFSLWARFLGNCSSISYPHQIKDCVHVGEEGFEIELDEQEDFDESCVEIIKKVYNYK